MIFSGSGDSGGRNGGDEMARKGDLVNVSQPFAASDTNSPSGDSIGSQSGANARRQSSRRKSVAKTGKTVAAPPPERSPLDDELNWLRSKSVYLSLRIDSEDEKTVSGSCHCNDDTTR